MEPRQVTTWFQLYSFQSGYLEDMFQGFQFVKNMFCESTAIDNPNPNIMFWWSADTIQFQITWCFVLKSSHDTTHRSTQKEVVIHVFPGSRSHTNSFLMQSSNIQVCQPSCPQTNYCNTCTQFASTGGFAQCQRPTCPNFIGTGMVGMWTLRAPSRQNTSSLSYHCLFWSIFFFALYWLGRQDVNKRNET